MTFEQAMKQLGTLQRFGSPGAVERVAWILNHFDATQNKLRFVHVTGTNGKGSTCAMVSAVLREAGYVTGMFISPYIIEFRERIQVDGKMIPKEQFASLMEQVFPLVEQIQATGVYMSEFELVTVLAILWFYRQKCDLVVFEVGVGGKRDSTNVVTNVEVSVITSVSLDHTEILGDTIAQITRDKCGIMKPYGTMVVAPCQTEEAMAVITEEAEKRQNRLVVASVDDVKLLHADLYGSDFLYQQQKLHVPLIGLHQQINTATALAVIEVLKQKGFAVELKHITDGLEKVQLSARWEIVHHVPLIIIDGAHNQSGISAFKQSICRYLAGRRIIGIMGALRDKDVKDMIQVLNNVFAHVVTITPKNPRAMQAQLLAQYWMDAGEQATAVASTEEALAYAVQLAGENDVILVFGSLFVAAEIREKIKYQFMEK